MADVTIKYNGNTIASMDSSGNKVLKTGGKYVANNIFVEYQKSTTIETNSYTTSVTFDARLKNGVVMALPENVLAHKDDANFVMMYQYQGDTLVNYRSYGGMAGNRKICYDQDIYGVYIYNNQQGSILYPINSTDGNFTVESVYKIKFYITDGKLYIAEDIGAGLDVGTYQFTFSW